MEDTIIEIIEDEVAAKNESVVALPMNFVSVGMVERESVHVYIKQDVYKRIEKFAKEQMSKEVGSILIGEFSEENDHRTVIISNYIEAKYTDATASTLTFTHETWDYVYKEKDKKYADKKIVGWQHTHPGYGIFLSNYDMFIQENFFNLPWQIAYVVDPIADTRGFFEWKDGKVSKLSGFYIYDEVDREIKIADSAKPEKKRLSVSTVVLSVLLAISVLCSISFGVEKRNAEDRYKSAQTMLEQYEMMEETDPDTEDSGDIESFNVYTVKKGDYLEKICQQYNLDYMKHIWKIKKINGITDVNKIFAGQKLYLPINK